MIINKYLKNAKTVLHFEFGKCLLQKQHIEGLATQKAVCLGGQISRDRRDGQRSDNDTLKVIRFGKRSNELSVS